MAFVKRRLLIRADLPTAGGLAASVTTAQCSRQFHRTSTVTFNTSLDAGSCKYNRNPFTQALDPPHSTRRKECSASSLSSLIKWTRARSNCCWA